MDLTGRVFGRWTVLGKAPHKGKNPSCEVRCECGTIKQVLRFTLLNGKSVSCGCYHKEVMADMKTVHGLSHLPEYIVWQGMWNRCRANLQGQYASRMPPDEWKSFETFYKDMGSRPTDAHTLERVRNEEPYGPNNCVWATRSENNSNKINNRFVTYEGQTKTVTDWSKHLGVSLNTFIYRLENWPIEKVMQ